MPNFGSGINSQQSRGRIRAFSGKWGSKKGGLGGKDQMHVEVKQEPGEHKGVPEDKQDGLLKGIGSGCMRSMMSRRVDLKQEKRRKLPAQ